MPVVPLIVRADATSDIGIGHVMRCIALAQAWQEKGRRVVFLSACDSESVKQRIIREGFELSSLSRTLLEGSDQIQQIMTIVEREAGSEPWVVLDGYGFTPRYQEALRRAGLKVLVIDDYKHHEVYHADILVNQNIDAEKIKYTCDSDTTLLLGTKYVLLRREFLTRRRKKSVEDPVARRILVTLGGGHAEGLMMKVVEALKLLKINSLNVRIVAGPASQYGDELMRETQDDIHSGGTLEIIQNGDMPGLMSWADMAVSGGGSTCWELAFMGVPFLVLILAENQEGIVKGLEENEAAVNCGWFHKLSTSRLAECVEKLIIDKKRRANYSVKARQLVDGLGAERILDQMRAL